MQSNTGRNDDYYANNVDYDIGHLISVSSYHVANSPWATSLNYYSRSITDNNRNTSPKNDSNVEQQKQNFLEVTPDAFRPVELPTTNAAMRTSSLTSLFASKNALSSSLKNSERRDRQYGNEDSIVAYPEIGHGIMSRTTSSARLEYFNNLNSGAHNDNYDDDEITNGHYGQYRTDSGHSNQRTDTHNSWSRGVDHRDADEVDYFVNSVNVDDDHDSGLGIQIPSYQSKRIGWTAAPTGEFQDIISVAKYHTDSSIKLTTSLEPVTKLGLERLRNASSPQLESTFTSQNKNMKTSLGTTGEHSLHSLRTTGEHSLPPSSQINFDPRNRGTHPPLVSAMRKKNIISSTETAVARVKIASSAAHATLSSDSEDSSDDDDDDDAAFMTTAHTHDSSENKEDSQELWRTVPAMKSKACFNFDLSTRQKTIMQRTKEKDKEKAKKTRGGVRFRSEGEFPPIFSPTENIMPYDDTQQQQQQQQSATWPTEGQLSSDTSKNNTGNSTGNCNENASNGIKTDISGKPRRSLLENNSILEVVSAAIEMLFSSSRQTTPATSVSPSPSTPSPYLSSSLPNHLQHSTYKQRSHFF